MRVAVSLFRKEKSFSTARKRSPPFLRNSDDTALALRKSKSFRVVLKALDSRVLVSLSVSPPAALLSLHR